MRSQLSLTSVVSAFWPAWQKEFTLAVVDSGSPTVEPDTYVTLGVNEFTEIDVDPMGAAAVTVTCWFGVPSTKRIDPFGMATVVVLTAMVLVGVPPTRSALVVATVVRLAASEVL